MILGHWCGPAYRIPSVKKTYDELHKEGFEIIGVSLDSDKKKLEDFVAKNDMPWPQFFDGKGWKTSLAQEHGISSIPAMWLVDKEGNLVDQNARSGLEDKVKKYLASKLSLFQRENKIPVMKLRFSALAWVAFGICTPLAGADKIDEAIDLKKQSFFDLCRMSDQVVGQAGEYEKLTESVWQTAGPKPQGSAFFAS